MSESKTVVEYRLLKLRISSVDNITVGLVHWDQSSSKLRYVFSTRMAENYLKSIDSPGPILDTIEHYKNEARDKINQIQKLGIAGDLYSLNNLWSVRSGTGAALSWTSIIRCSTSNSQKHFAHVAKELKLDNSDGTEALLKILNPHVKNLEERVSSLENKLDKLEKMLGEVFEDNRIDKNAN